MRARPEIIEFAKRGEGLNDLERCLAGPNAKQYVADQADALAARAKQLLLDGTYKAGGVGPWYEHMFLKDETT